MINSPDRLCIDTSVKQILKIALPVGLSIALPQLTLLTNTIFLAHAGEFYAAVVGICAVFYLMLITIATGLNTGLQTLFSRSAGEQKPDNIGALVVNGIFIALTVATIEVFFVDLLGTYVLQRSLHSDTMINAAAGFLHIRKWGLPFLFINGLFMAFLISTNNTRVIIYISLITEAINIFFDYGLIFGHFGFPKLLLNGAAYAAVLAEFCSCLLILIIIFCKQLHKKFRFYENIRIRILLLKNIINVSSPLVAQYLINIVCWFVFFLLVEHMGQRALAVSNIMRSVLGVCGAFIWSFASTSNTMVSNLIGQGRKAEVMQLVGKITCTSLCGIIFVSIPILFFPDYFLQLYTDDTALIAAAVPCLYVVLFAAMLMAAGAVSFSAITGTGLTIVNLKIEILAIVGYIIYVYIVVRILNLPLVYAWGSEVVYWLVGLTLSLSYLVSKQWNAKMLLS